MKHFQFRNELKGKNFSEVGNQAEFSLNIYRGTPGLINFDNFSSAFLASQIDESYLHDGIGNLPLIKNSENKWETRGHLARIVKIDRDSLEAISLLTEGKDTDVHEARFLQPFSKNTLGVFQSMSRLPSLDDGVRRWQMKRIWDETNAQKDTGVMRRETGFRDTIDQFILSAPMFYVGNPLYQAPRRGCKSHRDYESIGLEDVPISFIPRTNYIPDLDMKDYLPKLPKCKWDTTKTHVDFYRSCFRKRLALFGERSLIASILPVGVAHVDTIGSIAFQSTNDLLSSHAALVSLPYDFLIKVSNRADIVNTTIASLPWVDPGDTAKHRGLRLACLTTAYADLWNEQAKTLYPLPWHSQDPRLSLDGPYQGPVGWDCTAALRTDFARRMALVEIDVLVAQALGLTLNQLIDIYRIYFPVLQQNEAGTWYDLKGRIAWTCSKGLPGIGYLEDGKSPSRKNWEKIIEDGRTHLECEAVVDFMPGGPQTITRTFEGPFDTCDRVEDYKRAWAYFEAHKAAEAAV